MNIGEKIKTKRKELGISADQLAARLGKDRSTIYRYESKEIKKLPSDIIIPLAESLLVSPQYLIGCDDETNAINTQEKTPREKKYEEIIRSLATLSEDKLTDVACYLKHLTDN